MKDAVMVFLVFLFLCIVGISTILGVAYLMTWIFPLSVFQGGLLVLITILALSLLFVLGEIKQELSMLNKTLADSDISLFERPISLPNFRRSATKPKTTTRKKKTPPIVE
jgi:hypothetical protein